MKKNLLTAIFALSVLFANAQNYLHQVVIVNEGYYNYSTATQVVPVSVGVYNPISKVYQSIDIINGSKFASDVIVDNGFIYVAADNKILKYDANTYALVKQVNLAGVRKLAIWNNQLLVSRGEYLATYTSYFQVYDKNNLNFIYELTTTNGPAYASDKIVVNNDTAYIAVNNGFDFGNYKGIVGVVNLNAQNYKREIVLADSATNPENLMMAGTDLITVNNNDFSKSSVSKMSTKSANGSSLTIISGSGCSTSAMTTISNNDYVLYQAFGTTNLGKFDLNGFQNVSPVAINKEIYGIAVNPINNEIYTGVTNFTNTGKIYIHYANGFPKDSFNVSVSPGNIAFDLRTATSVENINSKFETSIFPNPANNEIQIIGNYVKANVTIFDLLGKTVLN
ncbi:MAG: hypothetical protein RL065_1892, partial [Bacteroidota bacterium]